MVINRYISSLEEHFAEYERLKKILVNGETFANVLEFGMSVKLGRLLKFGEGLYVESHKAPISTRFQLEKFIETYRYATDKAEKLKSLIKSL